MQNAGLNRLKKTNRPLQDSTHFHHLTKLLGFNMVAIFFDGHLSDIELLMLEKGIGEIDLENVSSLDEKKRLLICALYSISPPQSMVDLFNTAKELQGMSPKMLVEIFILSGDLEVIKLCCSTLNKRGFADILIKNEYFYIKELIRRGSLSTIDFLLNQPQADKATFKEMLQTSNYLNFIRHAVEHHNLDIVEYLLSNLSEPNKIRALEVDNHATFLFAIKKGKLSFYLTYINHRLTNVLGNAEFEKQFPNLLKAITELDFNKILIHASINGQLELLQWLEQNGAQLFTGDNDGNSVLHLAIAHRNIDIVKVLVSKYPGLCNTVNHHGYTPLMLAAIQGELNIIEIMHSADKDFFKSGQNTLGHRYNIDCKFNDYNNWQLDMLSVDISHFLENQCNDIALLLIASVHGHTHILEWLFLENNPVLKSDNRVLKAVLLSIVNNKIDFLRLLLEQNIPYRMLREQLYMIRKKNFKYEFVQELYEPKIEEYEALLDESNDTQVVIKLDKVIIPNKMICPITQCLIFEPVQDEHGHLFEKSALALWMKSKQTNPLTNQPFSYSDIKDVSVGVKKIFEAVFNALTRIKAQEQRHMISIDIETLERVFIEDNINVSEYILNAFCFFRNNNSLLYHSIISCIIATCVLECTTNFPLSSNACFGVATGSMFYQLGLFFHNNQIDINEPEEGNGAYNRHRI